MRHTTRKPRPGAGTGTGGDELTARIEQLTAPSREHAPEHAVAEHVPPHPR